MSTDTLETLLTQWKTESLTIERAIGQLLQHLVRLDEAQKTGQQKQNAMQTGLESNTLNWATLKKAVEQLQAQTKHIHTRLNRLEKHLGLPPLKPPGKRGRRPKK